MLFCRLTPGARGGSPAPSSGEGAAFPGPDPRPAPACAGASERRWLLWISGAVALAMLVMCLVLPVMVLCGSAAADVYESNLAWYKGWLFVVSVLYFIAAVIWYGEREKARGQG